MATGQANKLTAAAGEFLVAAELCRLGLLATPFAGNVPHYDIIASGTSGGHAAVQVKAINGQSWQFDIGKFSDIQMDEDGKRQNIGERRQEPFPDLMCVLVVLSATGQDRFFILEWKELQDLLIRNHTHFLEKHDFVRPRAPESFHTALRICDVEAFEARWEKILQRVDSTPKCVAAANG